MASSFESLNATTAQETSNESCGTNYKITINLADKSYNFLVDKKVRTGNLNEKQIPPTATRMVLMYKKGQRWILDYKVYHRKYSVS